MFVLFHTKFVGCSKTFVPLPTSTELDNKVVVPIPPREIDNVPLEIFDAFNKYNSEPEPVIIPDIFKFPEISTLTSFVLVPIPTCPSSNIFKHVSPSSWISIIGCAPVWFTINAGPVPSFVIIICSEFDISVFTTVLVPFTIKLPSIRVSPNTCNFVFGCVVPMPILLYNASKNILPYPILTLLLLSIINGPSEHNIPLDCIIPFTSNVVSGFVFPTPKNELTVSHIKFAGCINSFVPLPINTELVNKDVVPIPPHETDKVPLSICDAFNEVKPDPIPVIIPFTSNVEVGFVLPTPKNEFSLSHIKLEGCINIFVPLPTSNELDNKVVVPIPP